MDKSNRLPASREDLEQEIRLLRKELSELKSEGSRYELCERELKEKKIAYQAILEDLPDFICRFNPDGTITYVNSAYCTYVDKPFGKIVNTSVFSYLPRQDRKLFKQYLDSLTPDCPVRRIDYRAKASTGTFRWQQWSLRALFDQDGKVTEYLSVGRDITNLKHVEEGLIEALEKYSTIFECSNDAILLQEGDRIIDCNTAALRIFRYREKEVLMNKHYTDFSAQSQPDGKDSALIIRDHIRRALKRGMERFQWECKRSDGTLFPADVILSPLNLEGTIIIAAVVRDISAQKQTEDALRRSEEQYRELVENINDAIFSLDVDGTITYASPVIRKILGYTPDELKGKNFITIVHPEDRDRLVSRYRELLTGKLMPFEYRMVRKNGKPCWVRTYSRIIREGEEKRIFGLIADITRRKKAQDDLKLAYDKLEEMVKERTGKLREANRHLRQEIREREKAEHHLLSSEDEHRRVAEELRIVLDGITDLIILCDPGLKIVWANMAAARSLGKTPQELKQKQCKELWHNKHLTREECPAWRSITTGENTEEIIETPDGFIWEVRAYPLVNEHGTVRGVIEIARNVTERRFLEEEMQKRQKLESLGTLAGGIAHDFNNILTVILGNISLAKMLLGPDDRLFGRLGDVENASLKAKELTGRLLTFSKGGSPLKKMSSLERLLQDTAVPALKNTEIKPVFFLQKDLWPVEVDESQIIQVINNIIANAQDAMPRGGTVTLSTENITLDKQTLIPLPEGRYVKVSIADTGMGIEKDKIGNIFDPFYTTKQQGYGLGLATSYSIIKKHGGHITAVSQPGKGTSIIMYLPASPEKHHAGTAETEELSMGQGKILFMDDEEFIRDLAKTILNHLGYEVALARDGQEALQAYTREQTTDKPFDAVILDLTIPNGMGGKECIEKLRQIDPRVKAVVSSGYSNDPIMTDPQKYGFKAFIAKPYKIQTLSRVLKTVITGD